MRLGTCVAFELVVGGALATGLTVSAAWGFGEMRRQLGAAEAVALADDEAAADAAALVPDRVAAVAAAPAPSAAPGRSALTSARSGASSIDAVPVEAAPAEVAPPFDPAADEALLAPLRTAPLTRVKINRGGTSISLRLDFAGGGRASFKPEQTNPQSMPRREIAAYRIDRLLGIHAVAPAFGRSFRLDELYAALDRESRAFLPRLNAEVISHRDPADAARHVVRGEVQWWISEIENARIGKHRIDDTLGIVTWKRLLRAGATIAPEDYTLMRQLSTMLLFDFVIDNTDRWSGSNARVSPDGSKLYFMDNTLAFGRDADAHRKTRTYLERSQTFSRRLVQRLRGLTEAELIGALDDAAPFERLLGDDEIQALLGRRDVALGYIDGLIAEHGESAVLVFP